MKIKKAIVKAIRTPRVKAIDVHNTRSIAVVCLYSGELQFWDTEKLCMISYVSVCKDPVRTGKILEKMDWVVVGTDDGNITIFDLSTQRKINSFKAHDDFIRKIVIHPAETSFLTTSDDTTIKLWSCGTEVTQSKIFVGHNHFVMDACFYPNNSRKFISCSLDGTIKVWSVDSVNCVKTLKGHVSGINGIKFLPNSEYFISGSDDLTIKIWDFQSSTCITTLTGHTNNVNSIQALHNFPLFASCSEDGTVMFWNNKTFKLEDKLTLQAGRVWDLVEKEGKIIIGCDDELVFVKVNQFSSLVCMSNNRIIFSFSEKLFSTKTESLAALKLLSTLSYYPTELQVSPNGKLIALVNENEFEIFSSLGFRKKFGSRGCDFSFIANDEFVVRNGTNIEFYKKINLQHSMNVPGITKLFYVSSLFIVVNTAKEMHVISRIGQVIFRLQFMCTSVVLVMNHLVLCGETKFFVYKVDTELIDACIEQELEIEDNLNDAFSCVLEAQHCITSYCVEGDIFYFLSKNKAYYVIFAEEPYVYNFSSFNGTIVGIYQDKMFYLLNKQINELCIDLNFRTFQKDLLFRNPVTVTDDIRSKAISMYESLSMHEQALDLCTNENQKFEILLKLKRYDEAFEQANSKIKCEKLGNAYMHSGQLGKASECFFRAKNYKLLYFADSLSSSKFMRDVATNAEINEEMNLSFFANYKCGEFEKCAELLSGTPFYSLFVNSYLGK